MKNDKLDDLSIIENSISADFKPDPVTQASIHEIERKEPQHLLERLAYLKAKTDTLEIRNKILLEYANSLKSEKKLRDKYGLWVFCGICGYILFSLALLVLNHHSIQTKNYELGFNISDSVLIALVGSTSVNVVGLAAIILRFVFTNHHHKILDNSEL